MDAGPWHFQQGPAPSSPSISLKVICEELVPGSVALRLQAGISSPTKRPPEVGRHEKQGLLQALSAPKLQALITLSPTAQVVCSQSRRSAAGHTPQCDPP